MIRKFEAYKAKIRQREQSKQEHMSRKSTSKNLKELIGITAKELQYRKNDVTPNIFTQIYLIIKNAEKEADFYLVFDIYNIITSVDTPQLNEQLKQFLVPTTQ